MLQSRNLVLQKKNNGIVEERKSALSLRWRVGHKRQMARKCVRRGPGSRDNKIRGRRNEGRASQTQLRVKVKAQRNVGGSWRLRELQRGCIPGWGATEGNQVRETGWDTGALCRTAPHSQARTSERSEVYEQCVWGHVLKTMWRHAMERVRGIQQTSRLPERDGGRGGSKGRGRIKGKGQAQMVGAASQC